MKTALGTPVAALLLATVVAAQGTLSIQVTNGASSFSPGVHNQGSPGATIPEMVVTETLLLQLDTVPTNPNDGGSLLPRAVLVLIGAPLGAPATLGPFNDVWLDSGQPFIIALNSFANAGHPSFGPGGTNAGNTLSVPLLLNHPNFVPSTNWVIQAFAEDDPVGGFLLSGAIPFDLITPTIDGRALSLTAPAILPAPVNTAGGSFSVEGANLLVQSDWITRPPTVRLTPCDGGAAISSAGDPSFGITMAGSGANRSLSFNAPALLGPTDPPRWTVEVQNNLSVDPSATFALNPNDLFYDVPAPTITNIAEVHTFGVQSDFTITGTGFRRGLTVEFRDGSSNLLFSSAPMISSDTSFTVTVADGLLCAPGITVSAINCDGQSGGLAWAAPVPTISNVAEVHDPVNGGSNFTITGTGFRVGMTVELFDNSNASSIGTPALTVIDETSATFSVGAGLAGVCTANIDVVVTNCDSQSSAAFLHAIPAPTVAGFTAVDTAPGFLQLTLMGSGFRHGMTLEIQDLGSTVIFGPVVVPLVDSTTTTTVMNIPCPPSATIFVENCDGQRNAGAALDFPAPAIAAVNGLVPANSDVEGGQLVTVNGTGFRLGAAVSIEDVATGVFHPTPPAATFIDSNTLSFTTPAGCAGTVIVRVVNCDLKTSNGSNLVFDSAPATLDLPNSSLPLVGAPASNLLVPGASLFLGGTAGTQTAVTLAGTNFFGPGSPLATAFNIPAGETVDMAVTLAGAPSPGPWYTNRTTLNGNLSFPAASSATGIPEIGVVEISLLGPNCAVNGAAMPVTERSILVRHPNVPEVHSLTPNVSRPTGSPTFTGNDDQGQIVIRGMNFFSTNATPAPYTLPQGTTGAFVDPTNAATLPEVPLVRFGTVFSPYVEVRPDDQNPGRWMIVCSAPDLSPLAARTIVQVAVINPDFQESVITQPFVYLPQITPPGMADPELNEAALHDIIAGANGWDMRGIRAIANPCPGRDQARDPFTFQDPMTSQPATPSYDLAFVFDTSSNGQAEHHSFEDVNVPATIDLPTATNVTNLGFIGDNQSSGTVTLPAGRYRVIFKAAGFDGSAETVTAATNFPFVLASRGDLILGALCQMSGDAFVNEGDLETTDGSEAFRTRVGSSTLAQNTPPPAGGGRGGRGGGYISPQGLTMTSPASLLNGEDGYAPIFQNANTVGKGGAGASLLAFSLRSGTGAGHATPGVANSSGVPVGGAQGTTPADIFGGNATSDYLLFNTAFANTMNSFFGGSGGGGGGGSASVQSSSVVLGGRGGHGGGAMILLADLSLVFAPGGAVLAEGEQGHLGTQVFPATLGTLLPNVLDVGRGGSGASGVIYGLANITVCVTDEATLCPPGLPDFSNTGILRNAPILDCSFPGILVDGSETPAPATGQTPLVPNELTANTGPYTLLSGQAGLPTGGGQGHIRMSVSDSSDFSLIFQGFLAGAPAAFADGQVSPRGLFESN